MIKNYLPKVLDWIITNLQQWKNKLADKDDTVEELGFIPLSPVDDIDDKFYLDTLYWALKSRKQHDIKNIALTGPYGSGKSSVLKTFQKNYKRYKEFKFLNISLATFKEEENDEKSTEDCDNGSSKNRSVLSQIEVSILQQIFYHEKDEDIPDSRFKKIKSFNFWILLGISIYFILFIISSIRIFSPKFFNATLNINETPNWVSIASYLIFCSGLGFLIYKSIRIISAITIEKLKFQDAEIGFGSKTSKSILNHHLDEIFYFFEKGKYNVVIIEDLDRFKQTEIFTKLREINQLLNNSKKTKKLDITFIYAIRDEIFTDKERTKFFDFIIPIIPTINSSNSGDFLQTLNADKNIGLTEAFIEDIAFYIDDRRLLHNICNEFLIYKNKIKGRLSNNKLFALIAYKNVYPKDFACLSEQKGALYNAIQAKQQVVVERNNSLNEKIDTLKKELDSLNKLYVRNEEDLRSIYIFKLISKLNDPVSFKVGDRTVNFSQLVDEDNFNYFQKDKLVYNIRQPYGTPQSRRVDIPFESIENEVNSEKVYERLLKEIRQLKSGRLKQINQEINTLQEQKLINRNKPIHELIKEDGNLLEIVKEQVEKTEINGKTSPDSDKDELQLIKKKNVISRLLRSGYIAEDYTHYISIFHEGALTEKDNVFSSSVRNHDSLDFDFELTNKENLVKRINVLNFKTDAILNYDLVDFLIEERKDFPEQYEYVFEKLSDESERSIDFIKGFIKKSGNVVDFIKVVVKTWPNIWRHFSQTGLLNEADLEELFLLLLKNANVSDLENASQDSDFIDRIEDDSNFLNVISNQDRIIEILDHLGIKLLDVNMDIAPDGLLKYVYKNNHYQITLQTIKKFIEYFGNFDQMDWDCSNYKAIQNSECKPLIEYLNNEIQLYIDKVYLAIESNIEEEESHYKSLLNNSDISLNYKLQLIKRIKTKLSHIEQIEKRDNNEDKELKINILNEGKLEPTWDSLYVSYNDNLPWESIINFINIGDNAQKLGSIVIPETVDDDENYIYLDFSREILISNGIKDNAYNQILDAFPFNFDSLNISALSEIKVKYLIEHEILVVNSENFEMLKRHHVNSLIIFIEHNSTEIIENLDDFDFEGEDLNKVLNSTIISASNKNQFINGIEEQKIFDTPQNVQLVLSFLNQNSFLEIKNSLLNKLLLSSHGTTNTRIEVFNARHQSIESEEVINFLKSLPGDFKEIPNPNRRAPIPYSTVNEELLKILRDKEIINNYSKKKEKLRVSHKRS